MTNLEEYYNKYMKYKIKFLNLQNIMDNNALNNILPNHTIQFGGKDDDEKKSYCNSVINNHIRNMIRDKGVSFKNPIKFLKKFISELDANIPLILEKTHIDPVQLDIKLIVIFIMEVLEDIKTININTLEEKKNNISWIVERDSSTPINCYILNILISKFMSLLKFQYGCNNNPTIKNCKKCDEDTCKKIIEDADEIINDLEKYNVSKYAPDLTNNNFMNVPVKKMVEDILIQILKLHDKQYAHCNITLNNITVCYDSEGKPIFKLTNWYDGIHTKEYTQNILYKNNYVTTQLIVSPLLIFNDVCRINNDFQKKFITNTTEIFNKMGIVDYMIMSPENINLFLSYLNFNKDINKIEVIYRYHIDLYAFGIILYQLANKNIQVINKIRKVVNILRYTIKTVINNENIMLSEFTYFGIEDRKVYNINLGDLLNEISIGLIFTRNL